MGQPIGHESASGPQYRWKPADLIRFLRSNDLKTILAAFNSREVHPLFQFVKYGLCGVCALILHLTVFWSLPLTGISWMQVNPALVPDDTVRADHTLINNSLAFLFSNALAYWLNTKWVFVQGRHKPIVEFLLFTLVNCPGAIGGTLVQQWLIRAFGWPNWAAMGGFLVPNVLINFACRKLIIFQR